MCDQNLSIDNNPSTLQNNKTSISDGDNDECDDDKMKNTVCALSVECRAVNVIGL